MPLKNKHYYDYLAKKAIQAIRIDFEVVSTDYVTIQVQIIIQDNIKNTIERNQSKMYGLEKFVSRNTMKGMTLRQNPET